MVTAKILQNKAHDLTCTVAVDVYGPAVQLAQRLHLEVISVDPQETLSPHIPGELNSKFRVNENLMNQNFRKFSHSRFDIFGDVLREVVGVLEDVIHGEAPRCVVHLLVSVDLKLSINT